MRLTIIGKKFRCRGCGFWDQLAGFEQLGRCNAFPPTFGNATSNAKSARSITNEDEFCGFYKPDLDKVYADRDGDNESDTDI